MLGKDTAGYARGNEGDIAGRNSTHTAAENSAATLSGNSIGAVHRNDVSIFGRRGGRKIQEVEWILMKIHPYEKAMTQVVRKKMNEMKYS